MISCYICNDTTGPFLNFKEWKIPTKEKTLKGNFWICEKCYEKNKRNEEKK